MTIATPLPPTNPPSRHAECRWRRHPRGSSRVGPCCKPATGTSSSLAISPATDGSISWARQGCNINAVCLFTYPTNGDGTFGAEISTSSPRPSFWAFPPSAISMAMASSISWSITRPTPPACASFTGMATATSRRRLSVRLGPGPADVQVVDFNNDGSLDLIASSYGADVPSRAKSTSSSITATAPSPTSRFSAPRAYGIVAGDFNRDGNVDLVVANIFADVSYSRATATAPLPPP